MEIRIVEVKRQVRIKRIEQIEKRTFLHPVKDVLHIFIRQFSFYPCSKRIGESCHGSDIVILLRYHHHHPVFELVVCKSLFYRQRMFVADWKEPCNVFFKTDLRSKKYYEQANDTSACPEYSQVFAEKSIKCKKKC